jgi:hypothetical protein
MPHDFITGPSQMTNIRIDEKSEIEHWSGIFGLLVGELRELIEKYGDSVAKIREVFGKRASQRLGRGRLE